MNISDVMTEPVVYCSPSTDLADAALLMLHNDCGALPVVDAENKVVGMVTDRDISIGVATQTRPAADIAVEEVISHSVYSCHPDDDIAEALRTMGQQKIRRMPVVDETGVLQGIVSINDIILRAEKRTTRRKGASNITYDDAVSAMKSICEHWLPEPAGTEAA